METYTIFELVSNTHLSARIVQTMTCSETELTYWLAVANANTSSFMIGSLVGNYSESNGYIVNASQVFSYSDYPAKPSIYHTFDYATASWVQDEDMFQEQFLIKLAALKQAYEIRASYFYYTVANWPVNTHVLTHERLNIFRAFVDYVETNNALPTGWVGWIDMAEYQLQPLQSTVAEELIVAKNMLAAAESRLLRVTAAYYEHLQNISLKTTLAELLVYDINADWPTT